MIVVKLFCMFFGNISIVVIYLSYSAIGAQTHVVQLHFLYRELVACEQVLTEMVVDLHVKYLSAASAQEMGVWVSVAVKVHVVLVDGQSEHSLVGHQQLKRVIHRCARQCGHRFHKFCVDVVGRGVGAVVKQILHDCHALHRGSDVVLY